MSQLSATTQQEQATLRQQLVDRGARLSTAMHNTRDELFESIEGRRWLSDYMYKMTGRNVTECLNA